MEDRDSERHTWLLRALHAFLPLRIDLVQMGQDGLRLQGLVGERAEHGRVLREAVELRIVAQVAAKVSCHQVAGHQVAAKVSCQQVAGHQVAAKVSCQQVAGQQVAAKVSCQQVAGHGPPLRAPEIQAWPPQPRGWERVEDPVAHCLQGRSLLLSGLPARRIVEQLREAGDVVQLVSKTHCAAQNLGLGAQTADHWVRRTVRNGRCQLDWLVIEEVTQMDTGLWADVACVALDRGVRFLLMGDFRQLPAVLDSFAGARVERPLKDSDLLQDLAGGYCHELTENRHAGDSGWLHCRRWPCAYTRRGCNNPNSPSRLQA